MQGSGSCVCLCECERVTIGWACPSCHAAINTLPQENTKNDVCHISVSVFISLFNALK